jgi:hypothetical protein
MPRNKMADGDSVTKPEIGRVTIARGVIHLWPAYMK